MRSQSPAKADCACCSVSVRRGTGVSAARSVRAFVAVAPKDKAMIPPANIMHSATKKLVSPRSIACTRVALTRLDTGRLLQRFSKCCTSSLILESRVNTPTIVGARSAVTTREVMAARGRCFPLCLATKPPQRKKLTLPELIEHLSHSASARRSRYSSRRFARANWSPSSSYRRQCARVTLRSPRRRPAQ